MMGSRGLKGGWEYDMLTRYRRFRRKRPGKAKSAKRSFWKRTRKRAQQEARASSRACDPGSVCSFCWEMQAGGLRRTDLGLARDRHYECASRINPTCAP